MRLPWKRPEATQPVLPVRETLYLRAIERFLELLREAFAALHGEGDVPEKQGTLIDELQSQFAPAELAEDDQVSRLDKRVRQDCRELSDALRRMGDASEARATELADVVALLSRSVADATQENASFYRDIRAEGARIVEASQRNNLNELKAVLQVATQKLDGLVERKESREQSRIDALSNQVEQLKTELQEARVSAQTDPLTGALNRGAFDREILAQVSRGRVSGGRLVLILFDIDDFKSVNDRFGHPVGDRVLIAFAQRCQAQLRPQDHLARFGGEEFAVLMQGATLRNGVKRAARICESVATARYAIERGKDSPQLSVTVSAGVAAMAADDTVEAMIERADRALYQAKSEGKNRAVSEKALSG